MLVLLSGISQVSELSHHTGSALSVHAGPALSPLQHGPSSLTVSARMAWLSCSIARHMALQGNCFSFPSSQFVLPMRGWLVVLPLRCSRDNKAGPQAVVETQFPLHCILTCDSVGGEG
jgi:hypothetical protein